jgi:hypothetical protein
VVPQTSKTHPEGTARRLNPKPFKTLKPVKKPSTAKISKQPLKPVEKKLNPKSLALNNPI